MAEDPLAALDHEERQALAQLAQAQADGTMTRRQWLKLGAALGVGGLVGGGGVTALTGSAAADASTSDSDPDVGTPSNRADVFAAGIDANVIDTGELNNNYINLTQLVNDGTYTDIVDAIINEPENYPTGTVFTIEPGDYTVTTQGTITWTSQAIMAEGMGYEEVQSGRRNAPVRIQADYGSLSSSTPLLTIGDAPSTSKAHLRGGLFRGIVFEPQTLGNGGDCLAFNGNNNREVLGWDFKYCRWNQWGGASVTCPTDTNNGGHHWENCSFRSAGATSTFGRQDTRINCRFSGTSDPTVRDANGVSVWGEIAQQSGATASHELGAVSWYHFKNLEGGNDTGSIGCRGPVAASGTPTQVHGRIHGVDTGITVPDGTDRKVAVYAGIDANVEIVEFAGTSNAHNGSLVVGDAQQITVANSSNNITIVNTAKSVGNIAATDVPVGAVFFDDNRGGTGNSALVWRDYDNAAKYADSDGLL